MIARSQNNWKSKPGGWDSLHLEKLNFNGDYPILNCYEMPIVKRIANIHDSNCITENCLISTFVNDYLLERFWSNPWRYLDKFCLSSGVMSPDYSLLVDMPKPLQMFNVYKNRYVGFEWQRAGLNVIPTVSWSDSKSFEFCFEGIEKGSIVAVSNIGCLTEKQKQFFDAGYNEMLIRLQPKNIIFMANKKYRHYYEANNVIFIDSHFEKKRKQWAEEAVKAL
jgi:hypothetical protein